MWKGRIGDLVKKNTMYGVVAAVVIIIAVAAVAGYYLLINTGGGTPDCGDRDEFAVQR